MDGGPKLFSCNPPGTDFSGKKVFVAGAGGLGSNVAMMLARAGVDKFVLCDFDVVREENLNRQHFFLSQTGRLKVDALRENILAVNPNAEVSALARRLEPSSFEDIVPPDAAVIFECLDSPESKAELARFCAAFRKDAPFVAASGIAGTGPLEEIRTQRINRKFYVIGDGVSDTDSGLGTLSTRVTAAAAAQAHIGLLILGGLSK